MGRPRLKEVRAKEGLTQEQMAKRLGVSISHYKNIEGGTFDPSYGVMLTFTREFPQYYKEAWEVFQKEEKNDAPEAKESEPVTIPVHTDWGKNK